MSALPTLRELREGGKAALARALAIAEARPLDPDVVALLDAAHAAARAHVIGVTGTPGVGKSTLVSALLAQQRARGATVGVIAVDPSSRLSGGALLGDRARIKTDPEDDGVFVRSLAARDRLGGLSAFAVAATVILRAALDVVILESVGVGQSESDITTACDTVVLCVQPGGGDALQFMKAGVMELPHIVVVTKGDMGAAARKARADVDGALSLAVRVGEDRAPPILLVSASTGDGLDALVDALDDHRRGLRESGRDEAARIAQARAWVEDAVRAEFGRRGIARSAVLAGPDPAHRPFAAIAHAFTVLGDS